MYKALSNYISTHRQQLFKFIIIGITTFIINFSLFHVFYGSFKLNLKLATSLAYFITVMSHFLLHRVITFEIKKNNQSLSKNIAKYFVMLAINYITTLLVMWITVNVAHLSAYFGVVFSTAATAVLSFLTMKYYVFMSNNNGSKHYILRSSD